MGLQCYSQIKIGENLENIHPTSLLEIESSKGTLVLPRLTSNEIDLLGTPLVGSIIYNTTTDEVMCYTAKNKWQSVKGQLQVVQSDEVQKQLKRLKDKENYKIDKLEFKVKQMEDLLKKLQKEVEKK